MMLHLNHSVNLKLNDFAFCIKDIIQFSNKGFSDFSINFLAASEVKLHQLCPPLLLDKT